MNTDLYADLYAALTAQLRAGRGFLTPVEEPDGDSLDVASMVSLLESLAHGSESDADSTPGLAAIAAISAEDDADAAALHERIAELETALAAEQQARAELETRLESEEMRRSGDYADSASEKPAQDSSPADPAREHLRLLIRQLRDVELEIGVHTHELSIGRTGSNDLQFKDPSVSRRHALLRQHADVTEIIDCDSRNGVYVNDSKISRYELSHGDRVTIGTQRFVFICR